MSTVQRAWLLVRVDHPACGLDSCRLASLQELAYTVAVSSSSQRGFDGSNAAPYSFCPFGRAERYRRVRVRFLGQTSADYTDMLPAYLPAYRGA